MAAVSMIGFAALAMRVGNHNKAIFKVFIADLVGIGFLVAAAILKPFVSEANLFMVANHGAFQGYYFFEYLGLDKNMREQFKDSPHYEYCAQFCHLYDQAAFDPDYESEPLECFAPMVERVFSKPKNSMYLKAMQD